jgi:hypothetical protein
LGTGAFQPGPNDQVILQQFIESPDGHITRVELAGGRFLYAMCSSTAGGFELCPADACQVPASHPDVCPADASEGSSSAAGAERFVPADLDADDPLVGQYLRFCADEGFDIAGIEFVTGYDGLRYTYDVNGNTNYNSGVGAKVGVDGMLECARWIRARAEAGLWAL